MVCVRFMYSVCHTCVCNVIYWTLTFICEVVFYICIQPCVSILYVWYLYSTYVYVVYAPLADVAGWWWTQGGYLHCICICIVFCGVCSAWWWTQGGWGDYPILISSPASTPPPTNAIIIIIPIPIIITITVIIIVIRVIAQECAYFFSPTCKGSSSDLLSRI